ncbi:MAG: hypothetical protein ACFB3T_00660 [Geminicoccaceae bacterium]
MSEKKKPSAGLALKPTHQAAGLTEPITPEQIVIRMSERIETYNAKRVAAAASIKDPVLHHRLMGTSRSHTG